MTEGKEACDSADVLNFVEKNKARLVAILDEEDRAMIGSAKRLTVLLGHDSAELLEIGDGPLYAPRRLEIMLEIVEIAEEKAQLDRYTRITEAEAAVKVEEAASRWPS
ncbi:hypothetical protein HDU87_008821 [Geranomyces variabilis]|uniref:Uncharacterized protein n=1 Tax=Geranomyces variabilis TaxID=109894 RepID=A0AAD5XIS8_9FUNG|nr:hypothetical protein HDU87_008821 [Geranomyces variabilis]